MGNITAAINYGKSEKFSGIKEGWPAAVLVRHLPFLINYTNEYYGPSNPGAKLNFTHTFCTGGVFLIALLRLTTKCAPRTTNKTKNSNQYKA